jgi:hypothetical protein
MAISLKSKYTKQTKLSPLAFQSDVIVYSRHYVEWLEKQVAEDNPIVLQVKSLVNSPNFKGLSITMKSKK